MGQRLIDRHFYKEDIHMAKRHTKDVMIFNTANHQRNVSQNFNKILTIPHSQNGHYLKQT